MYLLLQNCSCFALRNSRFGTIAREAQKRRKQTGSKVANPSGLGEGSNGRDKLTRKSRLSAALVEYYLLAVRHPVRRAVAARVSKSWANGRNALGRLTIPRRLSGR
ncbi:hypothetical protein GOBAR_AA28967 [Gossypium barbadense]|uniref:Uncharacterized protein n=1 Tax=Gossypium barbadense TaxID=3634 RepID=A0A2P5WKU9_GOSBA|nr:hypothetical protein GOBAR_AA28967 [Gossypium barbadense]